MSLFWEDALAAFALLVVLFGMPYGALSLQNTAPQVPTFPPLRNTEPAVAVQLSHPIDYKAVVCQSGPNEKPKCRFYTEKANDAGTRIPKDARRTGGYDR